MNSDVIIRPFFPRVFELFTSLKCKGAFHFNSILHFTEVVGTKICSGVKQQRKCICHQRSCYMVVTLRRVGSSFSQQSPWKQVHKLKWKYTVALEGPDPSLDHTDVFALAWTYGLHDKDA